MKLANVKVSLLCLCLIMSFVFVNFGVNSILTSASPDPTIYIEPTPITAHVCENFTVALMIKDVTDLYVWQVKLSFNPSLLGCLGATEGPFLKSSGRPTLFPPPIINNTAGTVLMGCSLMIPPGVSGSGILAYIMFHCDGPGECDLAFVYPDTFLLDSYYNSIRHSAINGHVIQWWDPQDILDVELYPREVVDLGDPTSTQWHELHPSKTNYYHLMNWEPGYVLSPEDQIDMYLIEPPVRVFLETWGFDPSMPYGSWWHELSPTFCQYWLFTSWEDNNHDGMVSPCDQIDMTNERTGDVVWFHVYDIFMGPEGIWYMDLDVKYFFQVDEVTIDMLLSPLGPPGPQIFVEYKCGYWTFDPKKPICTKWNQIDLEMGPSRCLHLTSWADNGNGILDPSDIIDMTPLYPNPGPVEYYHVDFISISLKLTPKPSPPVVPPPPFPAVPVYLESAISYDEFDLTNPVCTKWHEIYPVYSRIWHLSSWENFYGLSPSDQIWLALKDKFGEPLPGSEVEYHVDKLTVAMNLTMEGGEEHIVKFEESLKEFKQYHWRYPISTQWHEVNPEYCRQWHILDWLDNGDGYLGYCDLILMIDMHTGWVEVFHVESLSTDMWLTIKHDIAVINVTPHKTVVGQGYNDRINVTVENQAFSTETNIDVTVYANGTPIQTLTIASLNPSEQTTLIFTWSTIGWVKGFYTIKANAMPVPGEVGITDNTLTDGIVMVTIPGDGNGDRICDMKDITQMILKFGSRIGDPRYSANFDITCEGIIDMKDITIAILHFGERW